jgi:membrane protein involved in colicin uptake
MAIEKIIKIDVDQVRALGGLDNLKKSFSEVDNSTKSLKQQMIEAQKEVTQLSEKFGATSKEAIEAAKRASELKDKIGDAKSLTDAFNPDAKFKSLSASLGGVASGFAAYQGAMGLAGVESKDLEKQLLKVQSAMAIAQGLQGLGEARDSFKQLKAVALDAFKGIKTAIGSTGIGLLVIALGTIYAYWDDIKEAVSGVSEEQKKLNADSKKNLDQENEKLKTIGAQDNILKLQGKSEKEILAIKVKQTDEAIQATEINQKNQIQTNKLAVEGAQRNYEMLKSYIDFVSTPLRFLYKTGAESINGIIDLLNKIPGVKIKGRLDEALGDKASDYLTKLGFDPEKVKEDGEKSVKESQDALTKLKNDRAGYQLSIKDIDKKANEDKKKADEEETKRQKEELEKRQKQNEEYWNKYLEIGTEKVKTEQANKVAYDAVDAENTDYVNEESLKKLRKKASDDIEIEKSTAQAKKEIQDATLNNIDAGIGLLKSLAGKSKALQATALIAESAVGIAKIIMNTQTANAIAKASPINAVDPSYGTRMSILNRISAGIGIASNSVALKSGLSALGGGGGGGSAPSGGTGGSSESTPPSFNIVGQNPNNQLAQSIAQQQNQPLQAFVVSGNVTTAQSLDRNKIDTATFN